MVLNIPKLIRFIEAASVMWHGTPDIRHWKNGSGSGIHVGTYKAAQDALCARIGFPADGRMWDGTRRYGDTLLAGKKTIVAAYDRWGVTGFNCNMPDEDSFAPKPPKYSNGHEMPLDAVPSIFKVKIIGPMTSRPISDERANSIIRSMIKRGIARRGYYYINDGEDYGSISAVVPSANFLEII